MKCTLVLLLLFHVYSDAFRFREQHHGIKEISKRELVREPPRTRGSSSRQALDCKREIRKCWVLLPWFGGLLENVAYEARVSGLNDICPQAGVTIQCFYDTLQNSPCATMPESMQAEATDELGGLRDKYHFICTEYRNVSDDNKDCVFDVDLYNRIFTCFRDAQMWNTEENESSPKICTQSGVESCVTEVITSTDHCQPEVIPIYTEYLRTHVLKWCHDASLDDGRA